MRFVATPPDREILESAIKIGKSAEDAGRILGHRGPYIKKYAEFYGIDTSHFPGKDGKINLLGKTFGRLKVIGTAPNKSDGTHAWRCLCECGTEVEIRTSSLRHGDTRSCGCLKPETWHHMFQANIKYEDASEASAVMVWRGKYNEADISFEDFKLLSQLNCFYCDASPANIANSCKNDPRATELRKSQANYTYNGLDRVDSSKLHSKDNVVPCCFPCNFAKNDLTINVFKNHIQNIIVHRTEKYSGDFNLLVIPVLLNNFNLIIKEKATKVSSVNVGDKLGKLTILQELEKEPYQQRKLLCLCECGTTKVVIKSDVLYGKTRSCNSGRCRGQNSPYIQAARCAWHGPYKSDGILFEEFFELSQMNCFYCNSKPCNSFGSGRSNLIEDRFICNGLDRIDPSKGHTLDNCIPCCITCNKMKSDRSLTDFDNWLTAINNHWLLT